MPKGPIRTAGLVVGAALLPILLRLCVLPWMEVPLPVVHDEFSYLLGADTFAHHRLANQAHPMGIHFETVHELMKPTYASKYMPGQALSLALGQELFARPWAGVCLGFALMCGAVAWMMCGWLPFRWAVVGTTLFLLRYPPRHYWLNSYWGGALAAAAGALVLGALPRIRRKPETANAYPLGAGLGLLMLTRPYEGLLFALPVLGALGAWIMRRPRLSRPACLRKTLVPSGLIVLAVLGFLGLYNHAVTGKTFLLPYELHERTYGTVPYLAWQPLRPQPQYNHANLEKIHQGEIDKYQEMRTPLGIVKRLVLILELPTPWHIRRGRGFGHILFTAVFLLSIAGVLRDRRMRVPLLILAVMVAGLLQGVFYLEHYAAPMAGLRLLVITEAFRRLRARSRSLLPEACGLRLRSLLLSAPVRRLISPSGLCWPALCLLLLRTALLPVPYFRGPLIGPGFEVERARITEELTRMAGDHLVLVRYQPNHRLPDEWVWNAADIDGSRIVWAQDMGEADNQELLSYYPNRSVWQVEADARPAKLTRLR